jgi:hypothetical protein
MDMAESAMRIGEEVMGIDEVVPIFNDPKAHLARLTTMRGAIRQENKKRRSRISHQP